MEPLLRRYHQVVDLGGGSVAEISQLLLRAGGRQTQALVEHNRYVGDIETQCRIGSLTDRAILTLAHRAKVVEAVH